MSRPTVGLALIAYNEEHDLPGLLESIEGAFDQVVLVDNHSTDSTLDVFRGWCSSTGQSNVVDQFEWNDDASAKRTYADSLLTTDWACWADCDDKIIGARNLRELAAEASPELAGYWFDYDYIYDDDNELVGSFPRERLIRNGSGTWVGRVHECQQVNGPTLNIDRTVARWIHRPPPPTRSKHPRSATGASSSNGRSRNPTIPGSSRTRRTKPSGS